MNVEPHLAKIYTAILLLPALGFFFSNQTIQNHSHFLIVVALIISSYLSYSYTFESKSLEVARKCLGCFSTALLVLFLSTEVSDILLSVYQVSFAEELTFMIKMILMLSNVEGNLDLCTGKEESRHAKNHSQSSTSGI